MSGEINWTVSDEAVYRYRFDGSDVEAILALRSAFRAGAEFATPSDAFASTKPSDADVAERIGAILREHQPTSGMRVASGVTCRCGYWTGEERPGVTRPVGYSGLVWHQAQMIATPPVAVEVEWEWHLRDESGDLWTGPFASEEQAQAARRESRPHWIVVRRRRAGPWIEVPPVAATGEGDGR